MPNFEYRVTDSNGQEYAGVTEAGSQQELEDTLRSQGYAIQSISPHQEKAAAPTKKKGARGNSAARRNKGKSKVAAAKGKKGKVKSKILMLFTRQLSTLVGSGLPLLRGLNILNKQEKNPVMRSTIQEIGDNVQSGSTFSESLAGHPKLFNKLYVNMVKAGELGGVLEVVLERLAEYQEKAEKLKNKIVSAMVYPLIVLTITVIIVTFLMLYIVPMFEELFKDMLGEDKPLPPLTRFVTGISRSIADATIIPPIPNFLIVAAFLLLLGVGYKLYSRTPKGRYNVDKIKLNIPVFGDILRKGAVARFSRTLGTLVSSGVPILQALNITRDTAGNEVISGAIQKIYDSVKEGEPIVNPMEGSKVFPPMVISMVDVGEETGQLPDMLLKIADLYDDEVDNAVMGATALLEPVMIVFLAVIVGTIVISVMLPMATLMNELSQ